MPTLTFYHLSFKGWLRSGLHQIDLEKTNTYLPADTIFSALMTTMVQLGEDPQQLATLFPQAKEKEATRTVPPFLLTSTFPYAGQVRFYPPPPVTSWGLDKDTLTKRRKALKRITFVSEGILRRMIARQSLETYLPPMNDEDPFQDGLYLQGGALWLTIDEVDRLPKSLLPDSEQDKKDKTRIWGGLGHTSLWREDTVPRVTVDRIHNNSNIYHAGRVGFAPGCGLWLGVAWYDTTWQKQVETYLDVLADSGIGSERSLGYGHFTYKKQTETQIWPDPQAGQLFLTLSRYHPRRQELPEALADEAVAYGLVAVGGWLRSPEFKAQRRRRLWLITEGSLVKANGAGPWGDICDVRPTYEAKKEDSEAASTAEAVARFPHAVWRYGLACPIAFGGAV